jgi:hypothetical protein
MSLQHRDHLPLYPVVPTVIVRAVSILLIVASTHTGMPGQKLANRMHHRTTTYKYDLRST